MGTLEKKAWLIGLVLVVVLPFVGAWSRQGSVGCCALDGVSIEPAYEVLVQDEDGVGHAFCSVRCAELWLAEKQTAPGQIWVTDEVSGEKISHCCAYYVRSLVPTVVSTENRIHVFKNHSDAEKHARICKGTLLEDQEKPFAN